MMIVGNTDQRSTWFITLYAHYTTASKQYPMSLFQAEGHKVSGECCKARKASLTVTVGKCFVQVIYIKLLDTSAFFHPEIVKTI